MGRRLILWRHGQTAYNAEARAQGQLDIPLDSVGRDQAERAAPVLAKYQPALVISSDLSRARTTAAALSDHVDVEVVLDPRLREVDLGSWQGQILDHLPASEAALNAAFRRGEDVRRGGGELLAEVGVRALAACRDGLGRIGDDECLVVVTHGMTALTIVAEMTGIGLEHRLAFRPMSNCAHAVLIEVGPQWRLAAYNVESVVAPASPIDRW